MELIQKYELLKKIGEGGMSTVYLAMDLVLNKQWAVKKIHKNTREYQLTADEGKLLKEVNLIKELDHNGLPRIVDIIDTKDNIYIVMDYIEGHTLRYNLDQDGALDEKTAVKYSLEILEILRYLHNQTPPIIYRDLKPSNIMVKPDGTIKIIDFGIARKYKKGTEDTVIMGTKGFAPPEQIAGKSDVRSDIYSFGVTLYQMLTNKSLQEEPYYILPLREINPKLSSGLEKIIDKCTKDDLSERYQTVEEVILDLRNYKKLEEEYIEKHRKKVNKFIALVLTGILLITTGIGGNLALFIKDRNSYDALVSLQEIEESKRIENLKKAIEINPSEFTAYDLLIKEYAKLGFSEERATEFFNIFNENKEKVDKSKKADLNFKIGESFVSYFQGETDKSSRNALTFSKSFFLNSLETKDEETRKLAESYVFLADYQDKYFLESSKLGYKEPSKEKCLENLEKLDNALINLENYHGSEDTRFLKLFTFQTVLEILSNQSSLYIANGIEFSSIEKITRKIEEGTLKINVNLKDSKDKKKEILRSAESLKEMYMSSVEYMNRGR